MLIVVARFIPGGRTVTTFTGRLRRDLSLAPLSHVRRDRRRDLGHATAVLLGYFGGKTFEEEPWKGLLLAFGLALAVTAAIEAARHLRARRRAKATA